MTGEGDDEQQEAEGDGKEGQKKQTEDGREGLQKKKKTEGNCGGRQQAEGRGDGGNGRWRRRAGAVVGVLLDITNLIFRF